MLAIEKKRINGKRRSLKGTNPKRETRCPPFKKRHLMNEYEVSPKKAIKTCKGAGVD